MKTCTCGIDIIDHPASSCLDALVAERVMKISVRDGDLPNSGTSNKNCWVVSDKDGRQYGLDYEGYNAVNKRWLKNEREALVYASLNYSDNISAAWELVEKILELPCSVNIQRDFHSDGNHTACYIHEYPRDDTPLIMAHAETTPLAICRAVLLTVEE